MHRPFILMFLLLCSTGLLAQRQLKVIDVETLMPIADANVVGKYGTYTSDSLGQVSVPDSSLTLSFSHVGYDSRIINLSEVHDTVFLISKLLFLREVVVLGTNKAKKPDYSGLNFKLDPVEAQLLGANPNGGVSLDLGKVVNSILPKRLRPGYKKAMRKERLKKILDDY